MEELQRLVDSGLYVAARGRFHQLLISGDLGVAELARGYHLASVAHYMLREVHAAGEFAMKAAELAGETGNVQLQLRAWSNLVEFMQKLGDTRLAIYYGDLWLAGVFMAPAEAIRRGRVHYNLALVYRARRDPAEALEHFRLALRFLPANEPAFRLMTMQMAAWLLYELREIAEGDEVTAGVAEVLESSADPWEPALREQLLLRAWREYHAGNHMACMNLCQEFLAGAATDLQKFWAGAMMAGCGLQLYPDAGRLLADLKESTIFYTEFCGQLALDLQEPRLINHFNDLRRRVKARWHDYLAG